MKTISAYWCDGEFLDEIILMYDLSKGDTIEVNTSTDICWIDKEFYDLNGLTSFEEDELNFTEESKFLFTIKEEFSIDGDPYVIGTLYVNNKQKCPTYYAIIAL